VSVRRQGEGGRMQREGVSKEKEVEEDESDRK
jgi:hypothetical protein